MDGYVIYKKKKTVMDGYVKNQESRIIFIDIH